MMIRFPGTNRFGDDGHAGPPARQHGKRLEDSS
jgi:hypothetical protein